MQNNKKNMLINAALFQAVWFSAVYGSANGWVWPCLILLIALACWQLHPTRRASTDIKLIIVGITMGLVIDSLWINLGLIEYTDKRPFSFISPVWILSLWVGFAMTINHSMAWLKSHPLLPILLGLISAPLSYLAGQRLGAMLYLQDTLVVSAYIGLIWAIALPILVRLSDKKTA